MAQYRVTSPDGTSYIVTAPDDASQADVLKHARSYYTAAPKDRPGILSRIAGVAADAVPGVGLFRSAVRTAGGNTADVLKGGAQGALLDPVEGIGQIIEHATSRKIPIPQAVRDWFDKYRKDVQSTRSGRVGELGGAIGSMFIPVGGEAAAAARAAESTRAGEAGLTAVRSALGPDRAGPIGYAAVRRALETPGEIGTAAVRREMGRPENIRGVPLWEAPGDYFPKPGQAPFAPSRAAAARRHVVPPPLPIGPPTFAERFRLSLSDLAAAYPPGATAVRGIGVGKAAADQASDEEE